MRINEWCFLLCNVLVLENVTFTRHFRPNLIKNVKYPYSEFFFLELKLNI